MFEALLSKGKDFFLRMFDIRVGEFRRVLLMQLNVFLLIQCLWIVKPVVNAQFLATAGITDSFGCRYCLFTAFEPFTIGHDHGTDLHDLDFRPDLICDPAPS